MAHRAKGVEKLLPWLILVGAVTLAGYSATMAAANVQRLGNGNGFVLARQADDIVDKLNVEKSMPGEIPAWKKVQALAYTSVAKEPLAANAVRNLALATVKLGDVKQGRQLMRSAAKLSRRDLPTHFWLIQDYGRDDDLPNVLVHVDQALRTKEAAWLQLIPALHAGLENKALISPIIKLLRADPPWTEQFWRGTERFPKSLGNIAEVAIGLQEAGKEIEPAINDSIINQLGQTGQYGTAYDIYRRIYKIDRRFRSAEYIVNSDFSDRPRNTIFDWTTAQNASLEVFLNPQQGAMILNVFGIANGVAASQVVYLPKGEYKFSSTNEDWNSKFSDVLYTLLTCNEPGPEYQRRVFSKDLQAKAVSQNFVIDSSRCRFYLLQLLVRAGDSSAAKELAISSMSIKQNISVGRGGSRDTAAAN